MEDDALAALFRRASFLALLPIAIEDERGLDYEGFGLVYLEAAAYGKPSIAASTGGPAEAVLDGVTGLLADPHDTSVLALLIERLLSNPDLCHKMGLAAYRHAKDNFSTASRIARLRDVYDRTFAA